MMNGHISKIARMLRRDVDVDQHILNISSNQGQSPKALRTTEINQPYTCQLFLSQMCEVVMTGICQNVPAVPKISDDFPKTFEHSGKCPKIFRRLLSTSEAIQKTTILACFHFTRTQSHLYAPFWNIFVETELNFRY